MGAIFAAEGRSHGGEWWLSKLKTEDLTGRSLFGGEWKDRSADEFLRDKVDVDTKHKPWSDFSIPFRCSARGVTDGALKTFGSGRALADVAPCLAFPPMYRTTQGQWAAAVGLIPEILGLRRGGFDVVIVVNALDGGALMDATDAKDHAVAHYLWQILRAEWAQARQFWAQDASIYWVDLDASRQRINKLQDLRPLVSRGRQSGKKAALELLERYQF
jgi:hypothetical protein